jgi:hypothetical protein
MIMEQESYTVLSGILCSLLFLKELSNFISLLIESDRIMDTYEPGALIYHSMNIVLWRVN